VEDWEVSETRQEQKEHIRDEDALVFTLLAHVDPCPLSDGKYMRRVLVPTFATVLLNDGVGVEGKTLVRVDCDQEETRVGLLRGMGWARVGQGGRNANYAHRLHQSRNVDVDYGQH
jgi:hypothetical protein